MTFMVCNKKRRCERPRGIYDTGCGFSARENSMNQYINFARRGAKKLFFRR